MISYFIYSVMLDYFLLIWLIDYHYLTLCVCFTPDLTDGLSLEYVWQVSSDLQDLNNRTDLNNSVWSRFFLWFLIPPVSFPSLWEPFQVHQIHRHPHVPQLSQLSSKIQIFVYLFVFFYFHFIFHRNSKIHLMKSSFFSCQLTLGQFFWMILADPWVSQSPREFYPSHFPKMDSSFCIYHLLV